MRIKGLTRIFSGSRATNTPRQTPNPPKRRPIQPQPSVLVSFAQWVCTVAAAPPQVAASPSPIGGNCTTRGSDTPATRRKKASCSAKPHRHRHGERQGHGEPGGSARERQKPDNRTQGRPHFRYKTLPAQVARPHFRYKTLHAHPPSPHVRDKTLPARPKWPDLAQSTHAGRVLYRFGQHNTEQGEFCTKHKAELGLATTPQQAPQVRKAPGEPQEPAA